MLARQLFRLARWPPLGPLVAVGLRLAGRWLPLRRVFWSRDLIGFEHPRPAWPVHLLLVPTTPIRDLLVLGRPRHAARFAAILFAAAQVLRQRGAANRPYVLCANGGQRQDVMQVHFHLLPGQRWLGPLPAASGQPLRLPAAELAEVEVVWHPQPGWQTHVVLLPRPPLPALLDLNREHRPALASLAAAVPRVHRALGLGRRGYTVLVQGEPGAASGFALHLIAGEAVGTDTTALG